MEYLIPKIEYGYQVSETQTYYESDLVNQWLSIQPGSVLESINFGKIVVINTGKINKHEGPDVSEAILIIMNIIVKGPVECHINTNDWFYHGHQNNPLYNDVILHVVRKSKIIEKSPHFPNYMDLLQLKENGVNRTYVIFVH